MMTAADDSGTSWHVAQQQACNCTAVVLGDHVIITRMQLGQLLEFQVAQQYH